MGYFLNKDKERMEENTALVRAPLGDKHVIQFKIPNYRIDRFWCLLFLFCSLVHFGMMIYIWSIVGLYYLGLSLGFLWLSYLCFPGWKKGKEKEDRMVKLANKISKEFKDIEIDEE